MDSINPGRILQMHGIEVDPSDPMRSDEILAKYIEKGVIVIDSPEPAEQPEAPVPCPVDPSRYKLYMLGVLALTGKEQALLRTLR